MQSSATVFPYSLPYHTLSCTDHFQNAGIGTEPNTRFCWIVCYQRSCDLAIVLDGGSSGLLPCASLLIKLFWGKAEQSPSCFKSAIAKCIFSSIVKGCFVGTMSRCLRHEIDTGTIRNPARQVTEEASAYAKSTIWGSSEVPKMWSVDIKEGSSNSSKSLQGWCFKHHQTFARNTKKGVHRVEWTGGSWKDWTWEPRIKSTTCRNVQFPTKGAAEDKPVHQTPE